MNFKFFYKNIKISFKKLVFFSYNFLKISSFLFEVLIYLNYVFNKSSFILKKILFNVLCNLKNNQKLTDYLKFKIKTFIVGKGKNKKIFNYRAKGSTDIILKRFCNIFLIVEY